ncbi:MAG TPA: VOC family protein [Gemmatimonadales bacterium]|nr:VOC family protein [Gemmatimonadales bacterium]
MERDRRIDYIELPATDIAATKRFYSDAFGWKFTDYGPDYTSFEDGRLAGGFTKDGKVAKGGPLVVIYADKLEAIEAKVRQAGATIVKPIFSFPGGRRFHFADPSGNELAVWSET